MRRLWLLVGLLIAGCSANQVQAPATDTVVMPSPANESAPGPKEAEFESVLDLPMYPGAKLISSQIVSGKDIPKTEKRYRLAISTPDAPEKIGKFYEQKGQMQVVPDGQKLDVMGLSPKGNQILMSIETDKATKQSKVAISVIVH